MAAQPDDKREQLFTERYEDLLAWAMRLTNQQRDAAEDLVQDAFVQFVLGRTRLEEIENIDGYLRRMLRYMHVSRLNRSAQHLHEAALSVADYDSCKLGWTAIEPPRRMQAFEELHQICTYACARKESSRAGSVLILRFFHDYFPTEIASILNSSRHCVDQWQRLARREVKLFMDEPGRLRFVTGAGPSDANQIKYLKSDCDLMVELRQMIFNSRRGDCLSTEELEEVYNGGNADALSTAKLAHIVSCCACLDAVNSLLGLPQLAQRYQAQPPEPKGPPGDASGGGASGGGSSDLTQKFAHRLRETHEHKPQELRIAINGFLVSSLKVSSDLSELDLNLAPDDPIEFVEVSSEQGVQMLFFSVDPAGTQSEQWAWIELSEGRSLEASFRDETGPSLHVVYKDPAPDEAYITGETPNNALSSLLCVVPEANVWDETKSGKQGVLFRLRSRLTGLLSRVSDRPLVAEETTRETQLLHLLGQAAGAKRTQFWRRPGWLSVLVSALIITGFLYFKFNLSRTVTAADLLQRANVVEQTVSERADQVRHRFINLEERRSAEGAIVAQHKIEIWENRGGGASAQRLYDQSNKLVGGTWQKDGARVVYHHGSKPQSQPAIGTPDDLVLNLDDIWQLQPSAQSFATLIEQPALAEVEERSATYVVRYEKGRTIGASQLLKATLTLSKSDLHPIEQTLLVLRGDVLREFRFVEASFELLPLKDVAPTVFELEPELTGGAGEPGRPEDWAFRDLTASRVPPSPSTSTPPVASAELEVDVAYLLNRAKADRNEQVNLTRSAGGSLRVEGVVESQERKDEFLRALATVINNPAVKIEIHTVAEATQQVTNSGEVIVQQAEETADNVAAYEDLRAYFEKRKPSGPTEESIRNYSSRMVNGSYQVLFHAIELKKLVDRFAGVDMRAVAPDARTKWLAMIHEHAAVLEHQTALLREEIQPVFFPGATSFGPEEGTIQSDADLARAVARLHKLALANNTTIRAALTISSQSSAATIKSRQFWSSLISAGALASEIKSFTDQ
ncbi:MAG TPA: RNA polymerase sigma factor [Pyrinomonadaceae bacterium]|nr:RNA polymerase sigma factor [Pyrinomonadaceae bacterium]